MAGPTARNISGTNFKDITECPVCLETFTHPKALPCFHTFCLKCIRTHGERQDDERKIPCPVCREEFEVPQGGYEKLKTNFFIVNLLDTLGNTAGVEKKDTCQICEGKQVSKYCLECDQELCETCASNHIKSRANQFHKVVTCEEKDNHQRVQSSYCEVHPDKQLELYCRSRDCLLPICMKCSLLDHRQHTFSSIEDTSREFTAELLQNSSELNQFRDDNRVEERSMTQNTNDFMKHITSCKLAIVSKGDEIKQTVDKQVKLLTDPLQSRLDRAQEKKNIRTEDIVGQNLIIESYQKYVEELTSKGSPYEVTRQAGELLERKKKIAAAQEEFKQGRLIKERVTYTPVDVEDLLTGRNSMIGTITYNDAPLPHVKPARRDLNTSLDRAETQLQEIMTAKKKKVPTATLR